MSVTREFADFVTSLRFEDTPAQTRAYARVLLADTVGAGLYGSTTPAARICWGFASRTAAPGAAPVWGRPGSLVAEAAALVNGTQAHAYEIDDYHPGAKLHPGAVVVPAALACAARSDRPVSGQALLTAVIAGYDVMIRASLAAGSRSVRRRGWHLTGVAGPLGSAAAAARLVGLDTTTTVHALGIAASQSAGLFAFSREGAMTKRLHAGKAAQAGLVAVALAADGFTGPSNVLEAEDGGLLTAISDEADPARGTEDLGRRFMTDQTVIKPYACCGSLHSSIDAVIGLAEGNDLRADDIEEIVAFNSHVVDLQCGFPYTGNGGALEAQMSLRYCLAVSAIDRQCSTPQFSPARLADPVVRALAQRVRFELDPEIDRIYPASFPARVGIRLKDGSALEDSRATPTGTDETRFDWERMSEKFAATTAAVLTHESSATLLNALERLDELPDVRVLSPLLAARA